MSQYFISYLWEEEEQQCLGEMAEDRHHCQGHAGEVTEGVTLTEQCNDQKKIYIYIYTFFFIKSINLQKT